MFEYASVLSKGLPYARIDLYNVDGKIYFGEITSQMHALIERLSFILMTYDDYSKKLFHGKVNCGCFYTMNVPQEGYEKMYEARMQQSFAVFLLSFMNLI